MMHVKPSGTFPPRLLAVWGDKISFYEQGNPMQGMLNLVSTLVLLSHVDTDLS